MCKYRRMIFDKKTGFGSFQPNCTKIPRISEKVEEVFFTSRPPLSPPQTTKNKDNDSSSTKTAIRLWARRPVGIVLPLSLT